MTRFYAYSTLNGTSIVMVRGSVASFVPIDEANPDYQAYLEWLAEGNTPEPWPPAE